MREHCPHCAYAYEVSPALCSLCHRRLSEGLKLPFIGRKEQLSALSAEVAKVRERRETLVMSFDGPIGGGVSALLHQLTLRLSRPPLGFRQVSAHPFTLNVTRTPSHIPMIFQRLLESLFRVDLRDSAQERERWAMRQLKAMSPPERVIDALFAIWSAAERPERSAQRLESGPLKAREAALKVEADEDDDDDDALETIELSHQLASAGLSATPPLQLTLDPRALSIHEDAPTSPPGAHAPALRGLIELTTLIHFFSQRAPLSLAFYDLQSAPKGDLEALDALLIRLTRLKVPLAIFLERPPPELGRLVTERVSLSPLSFQDLTELLSEAFPYTEEPIAAVEQLMRRSEGHPARVIETLAGAVRGGALSLKELKRSRVGLDETGFEPSTRTLLSFGAAVGPTFTMSQVDLVARSFDPRPWSELSHQRAEEWAPHLEEALAEGSISMTQHQRLMGEASYRFTSSELREGYLRLWSGQYRADQRRAAHFLLAEWMSVQEYTPEAQVQVGLTIAEHWLAGGAPFEAGRVSLEVGEELLKKGNHKLAYSALNQASQLLESQGTWQWLKRLYALRARASIGVGQHQEAESDLQLALKRAWQLNDLSAAYELGEQLYTLYRDRGFDSQATWVGEWLSSLPRAAQHERGRAEGALFDTFTGELDPLALPKLYELPAPPPAPPSAQSERSSIPPISSVEPLLEGGVERQTTRRLAMRHVSDLPSPPPPVMYVLQRIQRSGYEAWVVGGSVRDRVLGRGVSDWDLTTSATPQEVAGLFERVIETGVEHGTVTVLREGLHIEVTTYRVDGAYRDGRRPEGVTFTRSLREDLARRDFTINAMAWDPITQALEDPFGGLKDLERGLVRAVGVPLERFREDGLRSMRAIRFAATLSFKIEPETWEGLKGALDIFQGVAMERIQVELFKTLLSAEAGWGLEALKQSQMLTHIAPELDALDAQLFTQTAEALARIAPRISPRLAALFFGLSGAEERAQRRLRALKCSKQLTQSVTQLLRWSEVRPETERTDAQVRALAAQVGQAQLPELVDMRRALAESSQAPEESRAWLALLERVEEIKAYEAPQSPRDLALRGSELSQRLGIPPSKVIGELLNALLHHVWEQPQDNTVERLLKVAPRIARELGVRLDPSQSEGRGR